MIEELSTILIVDDEKINIAIILEAFSVLGDSVNIVVALSGEKALKIIEKRNIDLVLLDIVMPGLSGYEVCKILKSQPHSKDIPILFITAKTDTDSLVEAYNMGGVDYVTKPFRSVELLARVKTHLKLSKTLRELEHLASFDMMTGIYNRRKFFELSENLFEQHHQSLFAVMIDIDKFKLINDNYGHPMGDRVIKKIIQIISDFLDDLIADKKSIFGRMGGEEFALIFVDKTLNEIHHIVENIRQIVESEVFVTDTGQPIKATISLGVAQKRSSINNLDNLLQEADNALYEAKNEGRNKSIFRTG